MSLLFGEFELDRERRQLLRSGEPVPLEPKAYELLSLLLERRPRALSRAQIRDVVWPDVVVSESTLSQAVNGIRQALGDDARNPRFVRTAHGFGYAFCGEARDTDGRPRAGMPASPEPRPYPGLSAFTEADAERFFGREAEVAALWEKIQRQKLLAVIGPSGVGKTSFLRAGVIPKRPPGWASACATPGASPAFALAHALTRELPGDADAIDALLRAVEELSRSGETGSLQAAIAGWRSRSEQALLVVDQFEELFTLNPDEVQQRFAELLGRLADSDVHVLLSLRDDFLFRCSAHESLRGVFHDLTPLRPPSEEALRRALVEPARQRGFAFEEDALVEEMVETVRDERGALPLLAFAVSRLWEERDRERKLLTRSAYERIGGVTGALAQHAEATLQRLKPQHEGVVREIFRNLVTAEGTRAAMEREELLSVFGGRDGAQTDTDSGRHGRPEADDVLDTLVDARLLTEYQAPPAPRPARTEASGDEAGTAPTGAGTGAGHDRIEIVHESLLTAWPRLVMWQAQEEQGAVLRDQLRQAAHLWDERGRSPDVLWTGAAYLDFVAWRERYEGGLTASEEAFARAMTANAHKRRRRRRIAVAALVAALSVGVAVLWRAWHEAATEARRAEASELRALGTTHLESDPSAALAYAIAGLERFDSPMGRRFALEALAAGPPGLFVDITPTRPLRMTFSPNGEWLGVGGCLAARLLPWDGSPGIVLDEGFQGPVSCARSVQFMGDGDRLAFRTGDPRVSAIWSLSRGEEVRRFEEDEPTFSLSAGGRLLRFTRSGPQEESPWVETIVGEYDPESGETTLLERWEAPRLQWFSSDASGRWLALARRDDPRVYVRAGWGHGPDRRRVVARMDSPVQKVSLSPGGDRIAASNQRDEIQVWSFDGETAEPIRALRAAGQLAGGALEFDPSGRWLAAGYDDASNTGVRVWDLDGLAGADPVELRGGSTQGFPGVAFHPTSRMAAVAYHESLGFFPLTEGPQVLHGEGRFGGMVAFTPDGRTLVASSMSPARVRTWALDGSGWRDLWTAPVQLNGFAIDPGGRYLVAATLGGAFLVSLADGSARELPDVSPPAQMDPAVAISADGRYAAGSRYAPAEHWGIRIWDLQSLDVRVLDGSGDHEVSALAFGPDGTLLSSNQTGVVSRWDLADGSRMTLLDTGKRTVFGLSPFSLSPDGRYFLVGNGLSSPSESRSVATLYDLAEGTSRPFTSHGDRVSCASFDPTSRWIVTGDADGVVRVGPVTGETPHLLLGHRTLVRAVAISPDGRWVASSESAQPIVRLWPMPEGRPLHALPYDELMARLRAMTNLRVGRSEEAASGYQLDYDPFPGWVALAERTAR